MRASRIDVWESRSSSCCCVNVVSYLIVLGLQLYHQSYLMRSAGDRCSRGGKHVHVERIQIAAF